MLGQSEALQFYAQSNIFFDSNIYPHACESSSFGDDCLDKLLA